MGQIVFFNELNKNGSCFTENIEDLYLKLYWSDGKRNEVIVSTVFDELNTSVIHSWILYHWFRNHMALTFVYFLLLIYGSGHCFRIGEKIQSHRDLLSILNSNIWYTFYFQAQGSGNSGYSSWRYLNLWSFVYYVLIYLWEWVRIIAKVAPHHSDCPPYRLPTQYLKAMCLTDYTLSSLQCHMSWSGTD